MTKSFLFWLLIAFSIPGSAQPFTGSWISTSADTLTTPNTWHCFRKTITVTSVPTRAPMRLAVDTKYWLWINGKLAVYEGGLKRGPTPRDTYYDELDIAPFLKQGQNTVAVLVWFWGGKGFSHKNSGRCGLYADCPAIGLTSNAGWKARVHPAYAPSKLPKPNFRLSEPHIYYDARNEFSMSNKANLYWFTAAYDDPSWPAAVSAGTVPAAPWNALIKRPIPFFKDYGLRNYVAVERHGGAGTTDTLVGKLPYNCQFSPVLTVKAAAGRRIFMGSDTYYMGAGGPTDSLYTTGSEYITKAGLQTYESYGWLSGHEVRYVLPKDVAVISVQFRETGYNATFAGSFTCNDSLLTRLWKKSQRTLYVNMRDNYMDCPDRERAQWSGDAAMEMGQSFYALDTNGFALSRKLYLDLANWQRPDGVIYNPVPEDNWKDELPAHSLMPLSELSRFFRYTHDTATIRQVYPALRRYLAVWELQPTGQLLYRKGGWDWGDWGENQDLVLIQHGWYLKTLQTAREMANLLHHNDEATQYAQQIAAITTFLNSPDCWNGRAYHHKDHKGQTDDRANALMILTSVADSTKWEALSQVFKRAEHASPWMEKFVLESLFKIGRPQQAIERMRRRFRPMTESSFSTLWELWKYELSEAHGNTGNNHGWSGGPLVLLSEYVAGVSPSREQANTYLIRPTLTDLQALQTTVPTPQGLLHVRIAKTPGAITLTMQVPPNTRVMATLPADSPPFISRTLNGQTLPNEGPDSVREMVTLGPGKHVLMGRFAK
ncbi:alpha-L-rhamnosidase-related protein [Spirosoma arcticum]